MAGESPDSSGNGDPASARHAGRIPACTSLGRPVDRASASGAEGRGFESHPRHAAGPANLFLISFRSSAPVPRGVRTTVSTAASQAADAGPTPVHRSKGHAVRHAPDMPVVQRYDHGLQNHGCGSDSRPACRAGDVIGSIPCSVGCAGPSPVRRVGCRPAAGYNVGRHPAFVFAAVTPPRRAGVEGPPGTGCHRTWGQTPIARPGGR